MSFFASNSPRRAKLSRHSLPFLFISELSHKNLRMRLFIHSDIRDARTVAILAQAIFSRIVRRDPVPPKKEPRGRCLAEVLAMASSKVARIQAAIANLAVDDIEEKASLEAALVRANVKPLSLQSTSALQIRWHSSNAKKRVAAESTKILDAEKMRRIC